jgi:hypothetical protein
MSNILLESDFLTVDLGSVLNTTTTANTTNDATANSNTQASTAEQPSNELEAKLAQLGFSEEIIKKLLSFGEPFKKACKVLGFKIELGNGSNPILAFVHQPWVQKELLNTGLLNVSTFKAIYNAVAKKLVADSEFFAREPQNDYNIIYCKDLYRRSAKEIEEYLILQRSILTGGSYTSEKQLKNRRIFLHIAGITNARGEAELDPKKYAQEVQKVKEDRIPKVFTAKLNSLAVAKELSGNNTEITANTVSRSNKELVEIAKKLTSLPEKLAAIFALSTTTKSKKAKRALQSQIFNEIKGQQLTQAFLELSSANILPEGQLKEENADALVEIIWSTLKTKGDE